MCYLKYGYITFQPNIFQSTTPREIETNCATETIKTKPINKLSSIINVRKSKFDIHNRVRNFNMCERNFLNMLVRNNDNFGDYPFLFHRV